MKDYTRECISKLILKMLRFIPSQVLLKKVFVSERTEEWNYYQMQFYIERSSPILLYFFSWAAGGGRM